MDLPSAIRDDELDQLVIDAKDSAFLYGLLIRATDNAQDVDQVVHAPFTLLPTPVPRRCFLEALAVQTDFNVLMHRVARCPEFLFECLGRVIENDEFIRQLWNICETVHRENKDNSVQSVILAMNRSDYMIGCEAQDTDNKNSDEISSLKCGSLFPSNNHQSLTELETGNEENGRSLEANKAAVSLKQIEFNTIAVGATGSTFNVNKLHRYIINRLTPRFDLNNVPENTTLVGAADALVQAWKLYGNPNSVIVFLVCDKENNVYDQRWIEHFINFAVGSIRVIRRSLKQVTCQGHMTSDKQLIIDDMEVAVVYLRSCYNPSDFTTDDDWKTRLMMERSRAIVCPTVGYQLAGTKKVQQMLTRPGVVERFVDDISSVKRIRSTFTDILSLDLDDEGNKNAQMAIEKPHLFVMKPQREGGGNNIFGEEIREKLKQMHNSADRSSWILMRKLCPLEFRNFAVAWQKNAVLQTMVSEIGIYGALIADGDNILMNTEHGFLVRTKRSGVNEGGIASGCSCLDSPYLINI